MIWAIIGLLSPCPLAQEPTPESAVVTVAPPAMGRWSKSGSSLVYYAPDGGIAGEIGLGSWEEPGGQKITRHSLRGGTAPHSHFAWTLDETAFFDASGNRSSGSRRVLRFWGSHGRELWSLEDVAAPQEGEPLVFSENGQIMAIAVQNAAGWALVVKNYMGSVLAEAGPFSRLQAVALSPNGKFALARWLILDQSSTHTLLDAASRKRKDIPSGEFYLGPARLANDGKVYTGKKLVYDFSADPGVSDNPAASKAP